MSKDAARSLKVAMDVLGQPLENLTWDKELRERTRELIDIQRKMGDPAGFEEQMVKIRNIRFEFTIMQVELQTLARFVVTDLMKALGTSPDELLAKLREFNKWVQHSLPQLSQELASDFVPVWRQLVSILYETTDLLKDASVDFDALVGTLSGDDSISQTTADMHSFATSIAHVVFWVREAERLIAGLEKTALNAAMILLDLGKIIMHVNPASPVFWKDIIEGKDTAAMVKGLFNDMADRSVKVVRGLDMVGGAVLPGPVYGDKFDDRGKTFRANNASMGAGYEFGSAMERAVAPALATPGTTSATGGVDWTRKVPVDLLRSLVMVESGGHQGAVSPKGAIGLTQLMPETAKAYGVNPFDARENLLGGSHYLYDLLRRYGGNTAEAIGAYNAGPGRMDAFLAGKTTLPMESQNEIARVLARMGQTGSVQVGSVTINIQQQAGESSSALAARVKAELQDSANKRVQRNLAEFQALSPSY
jgi:Transglycosylase SLT domain